MVVIPLEIERRFDAVNYRLEGLETFKKEYQPMIDELVKDSVIESAVNKALKEHNVVSLTRVQKAGALVIFAISITDFIKMMVG